MQNAYSPGMPPTRHSTAALPLAPAVYLVLLALLDSDAHGYRIRAEVIERSGGTVTLDPGSLYRLIARLVADGLIVEAPRRPLGKGDDERRRYYRITAVGRRTVDAETSRMASWVAAARAAGRSRST